MRRGRYFLVVFLSRKSRRKTRREKPPIELSRLARGLFSRARKWIGSAFAAVVRYPIWRVARTSPDVRNRLSQERTDGALHPSSTVGPCCVCTMSSSSTLRALSTSSSAIRALTAQSHSPPLSTLYFLFPFCFIAVYFATCSDAFTPEPVRKKRSNERPLSRLTANISLNLIDDWRNFEVFPNVCRIRFKVTVKISHAINRKMITGFELQMVL